MKHDRKRKDGGERCMADEELRRQSNNTFKYTTKTVIKLITRHQRSNLKLCKQDKRNNKKPQYKESTNK